jgi:ApaG protein
MVARRYSARDLVVAIRPRTWHVHLVSLATTEGIKVMVRAVYVPEQSSPRTQRYVFAYTVKIANEGETPAQLRSRHWIITDAEGRVEEVKGPGVVGQQPYLNPGDQFEYTSGCVLTTPRGEMRGTYQMFRPDGRAFEAAIAPFSLALPYSLN